MPRQDFFVPYLLLNHVKYYLNSELLYNKIYTTDACSYATLSSGMHNDIVL